MNKKTVAILSLGKKDIKGTKIIQMDAALRRNLGVLLEDIVEIRKIEASLANIVTFAGLEEAIILKSTQHLAKKLESRVITKDDILSFYAYGRRVDLVVVDYNPKVDAVRIHLGTKIILSEKSYKEFTKMERLRVDYGDIGGLEEEIQKIREVIELPIRHPELYNKIGISHPKGVLLYGPPGTGKTLLARAVAYESDAHFITISSPEIMSKFYGESEENLRKIFDKAKDNAPSIIIIDNLDSIAIKRSETSNNVERRVLIQLISLMDDLKGSNGIFVIGATNRINDIDPALRTPGRFGVEIEIEIPNIEDRKAILMIHTRNMQLHEDVDLKSISEKTQGFVGAELEMLVKNAVMLAIQECLPELNIDKNTPEDLKNIQLKMKHFERALANKTQMSSCPNCGAKYQKGEEINFCQKCGEKLIEKNY